MLATRWEPPSGCGLRSSGANRARTGDLRAASATLSQLSYSPEASKYIEVGGALVPDSEGLWQQLADRVDGQPARLGEPLEPHRRAPPRPTRQVLVASREVGHDLLQGGAVAGRVAVGQRLQRPPH